MGRRHEGFIKPVVGWLLNEAEREDLLRRFPPIYADVVAHHVTLRAKAPANAEPALELARVHPEHLTRAAVEVGQYAVALQEDRGHC